MNRVTAPVFGLGTDFRHLNSVPATRMRFGNSITDYSEEAYQMQSPVCILPVDV